ncbi:MAG: type VI secretion system membrane subunit TssM [Acidobacteriota bacterium]
MSLLKNFIVWTGLVLLALIALIWFVGPLIGLSRVDFRVFAALVLIVLWVILIFMRKSQPGLKVKPEVSAPTPGVSVPSSSLSPALSATAVPTAQSDDEVSAFRSQMERAIQWLRGSKLGKSGQQGDVVYRIPWYLALGPTSSGKSTLISRSGLSFPYSEPDRSLASRGIEPTRNCDLWIANEALFIDSSGRYCDSEKDKAIWVGLLDQIRRLRKDKPLDGVLLAVNAASVVTAGTDQLKDLAKKIRARLDEMAQRLGMIVPVYLLFTKTDQLVGFSEFFADLSPEDQKQVWGCTFRREQYQSLQLHQEFEKELRLLIDGLISRRTPRLTSRASENRDKVFAFPLQLQLAKASLVDFITELFQANSFRERPLFRGFYFVSSTQEGAGVDLSAEYIDRKAQFPALPVTPVRASEIRSCFIQNLLRLVVFPDRILAGSSAASRRKGLLIKIALGIGFGLLLPLFLWMVIRSYSNNQALLRSIERARSAPLRAVKSPEELTLLADLRQQLEHLDDCPHSPSKPGFQWGMFIGDRVSEAGRRIYAQRLKQTFIAPSAQDVRIELRDDKAATPLIYNALKTFLMMTEADPIRADDKYLSSKTSPLPRLWFQGVRPQDKDEAQRQLEFYLHLLAYHKDPNYLVARNQTDDSQLIASRRQFLLTFDVVGNYYSVLQAAGNQKAVPMNLNRALEGKDLDLFAGGYEIPGSFTRNGWETSVKEMIETISQEYDRGSWVLAAPATGVDPKKPAQEAMTARLSELYFSDYAGEWSKFLRAIKIAGFKDRKDAAERLGKLTKTQDSPMLRLFRTIADNTWSGLDGKSSGNVDQDGLIRSFRPIHQFVASATEARPASAQYLEVLGKVYKELYAYVEAGEPPAQIGTIKSAVAEALGQTALLTQNFTPEATALVKPLLEQPIKMALTLTPVEDAPMGPTPTLAPLVPPSPGSGGGGSGLVVGGRVTVRGEGEAIEKAVLYLLKAGSREVTLNNYLTLATTDSKGLFKFPKAMPPGKYGLFVKAKGFRTVAQDIELTASRSQLNIALARE